MSIWTRLRGVFRNPRKTSTSDGYTYGNPWGPEWRETLDGMSVPTLYATQPHLQTVVNFRARNVAQLPLQLFQVAPDGTHERLRDTTTARLLANPNGHATTYELIRDTVTSLDLYGVAYWTVFPTLETVSGWCIELIPKQWVEPATGGTVWEPTSWRVKSPYQTRAIHIPAANMIRFANYETTPGEALSPVKALKHVLAEQIAAWDYRQAIWARGGRVGTYVSRPAQAPLWSDEARGRFTEEWHQFQAGGARAGESPLLEDGMEIKRVGFSAREEEWAEASRLSLETVCGVYHVAPSMLGMSGTSTYASMREFRSMLYTETLGPLIRQLEERISKFVIPLVEPEAQGLTAKFNIDAKLSGSFEEQAAVLSTATGAPWMAVNEARALRNLPPTDGGDDLIVPLNVTKGGQASPQSGAAPLLAIENARDARSA